MAYVPHRLELSNVYVGEAQTAAFSGGGARAELVAEIQKVAVA